MNSKYENPITIGYKSDTFKIAIDAGLPNATTDKSKCHLPILPVQVLIPCVNGTFFSTIDPSTADHQVVLIQDAQNLDVRYYQLDIILYILLS